MTEKAVENRDLNWKTHGQVFISLNEKVDQIINLLAAAHGQPSKVQGVYLLICGVNQKYSMYMGTDSKLINDDLKICDTGLRNSNYLSDLTELKRLNYKDQRILNKILKFELKFLNLLSDILTRMCANFANSELFPKPVIKIIKAQPKHLAGASL